MEYLEFIETPMFSSLRKELMKDDEFQKFQSYLLEHHEKGDTISHTGGCKKVRWGREGMGKRGGVRVIYYTRTLSGKIYLLLMYPKNSTDNITEAQKAVMKSIAQKLQ